MAVSFPELLTKFAAAVVANDGAGLGALFTPDGTYADEFFGAYSGRAGIAEMLQRFHDTGSNYQWDFIDPVRQGNIGYARFRFSFASRIAGSEGKPVIFEGISQFHFAGDSIERYSEAFDRGLALVQLDFPAERIKRVLVKAAETLTGSAGARPHLDRFQTTP